MPDLYIVQNDTHMKNFSQMMKRTDFYIDISNLTGQKSSYDELLAGFNEIELGIDEVSFFSLSSFKRVFFLLKNSIAIKRIMLGRRFDNVIIGNDGAIVKLILNNLDYNPIVYMWLDGLLSLRQSYRLNILKLILIRSFECLNLSYLCPSVIGFDRRISKLYVMDESVKNEYNFFERFINLDKVEVKAFPRHEILAQSSFKVNTGFKLRVLYLTSAWEFHGHKYESEIQDEQIKLLLHQFSSYDNVEFVIRTHPRENKFKYEKYNSVNLSEIKDFEVDILSSDFIISARSTGLFEADKFGKNVAIFNHKFSDSFMNDYFKNLAIFESAEEICELVVSMSSEKIKIDYNL